MMSEEVLTVKYFNTSTFNISGSTDISSPHQENDLIDSVDVDLSTSFASYTHNVLNTSRRQVSRELRGQLYFIFVISSKYTHT